MAYYMITASHEPELCLDTLGEILAKRTDSLNKFVFGCKEGDHTGYAIIDAESWRAALGMLPDMMQETVCIAKVERFTPADIESFHARMA